MPQSPALFVKGITGPDESLDDGKPQIAFIGRSNVGKSSVINSLTRTKNLARTSSLPGRTREIILFLINTSVYFVDVPGYGFATGSKAEQEKIQALIYWYLFVSPYQQKKVVLIIDAVVGLTENDKKMLFSLREHNKEIVVVANKIDRLKNAEREKRLEDIQNTVGDISIIPYSAKKNIGAGALFNELLR